MRSSHGQVDLVHHTLMTHLGEAGAVYVARMAMGMILDPAVQGQRSLEVASGLNRDTVAEYLPQTGQTAYGLLYCLDRGDENTYWDHKTGQYSIIGNRPAPLSVSTSSDQGESYAIKGDTPFSWPTSFTERPTGGRSIADVLADGRKSLRDQRFLQALDPSRDIWASRQAKMDSRYDCRSAGHWGWALAVLLGCRDESLPLAQVKTLLGLSDRQVYNVLAQLEEAGLASKRKVGRHVVVDFFFASVLVDTTSMLYVDYHDRRDRAVAKQFRHKRERDILASRRTEHGILAWVMIRRTMGALDAPPVARALYRPENELKIAAMFAKQMNRRLTLAA